MTLNEIATIFKRQINESNSEALNSALSDGLFFFRAAEVYSNALTALTMEQVTEEAFIEMIDNEMLKLFRERLNDEQTIN
jgi:hypothetical protein